MKLFKCIFILSCFMLFLGCSDSSDVYIHSSTQDVQDFLNKKSTGFIIITNETNAYFLDEVQTILLENQQKSLLFNVFYNDGKNKNSDGLSKNPFNFEMPTVNSIYYIEDGKVLDEFGLDTYRGLEQQTELNYFLDIEKRVVQNE